ncbi:hypothetical protein BDR06DRAFT_1022451 [Suillus hirtellus]|nr:hypothetical protein BDR06DRAFT_1022451 [Suillus hirtellus]
MGDFTAYQLVLNLSYSSVLNFSDYDFVVIGVGSRHGLQRCFKGQIPHACEIDIIRWMQLTQSDHFSRLKLEFNGLGPKARPIMLCDIEHTLCEIDKYMRKIGTPPRRPLHPSGTLPKLRLPKAWTLPARQSLRIKCPKEAKIDSDDASWEPEDMLADDAPNAIKAYWKRVRGMYSFFSTL